MQYIEALAKSNYTNTNTKQCNGCSCVCVKLQCSLDCILLLDVLLYLYVRTCHLAHLSFFQLNQKENY